MGQGVGVLPYARRILLEGIFQSKEWTRSLPPTLDAPHSWPSSLQIGLVTASYVGVYRRRKILLPTRGPCYSLDSSLFFLLFTIECDVSNWTCHGVADMDGEKQAKSIETRQISKSRSTTKVLKFKLSSQYQHKNDTK